MALPDEDTHLDGLYDDEAEFYDEWEDDWYDGDDEGDYEEDEDDLIGLP